MTDMAARDPALTGKLFRWRAPNEPQTFLGFILNAPAMALLLIMVLYPIAYSFWVSLHDLNLRRPNRAPFVGLQNYQEIIGSDAFWGSLRTTAIFAGGSIVATVVLGVLLALLLNENFFGRSLLRAVTLLPWAIPPVVTGLIWQWMLQGQYGIINSILFSLGIIDSYRPWLSQADTAMVALIVAETWSHLPFVAIVILAALQTIPGDLYDAAKVDGANVFQRFMTVTLPWISPGLMLVLITQTMVALRAFDLIYVLTGGGPGSSTSVLAWATYQTTFSYGDFGNGNAYAYILAFMTLILALIYMRLLWRREVNSK